PPGAGAPWRTDGRSRTRPGPRRAPCPGPRWPRCPATPRFRAQAWSGRARPRDARPRREDETPPRPRNRDPPPPAPRRGAPELPGSRVSGLGCREPRSPPPAPEPRWRPRRQAPRLAPHSFDTSPRLPDLDGAEVSVAARIGDVRGHLARVEHDTLGCRPLQAHHVALAELEHVR